MTIADYIEQDLESRIRSGNGLPDKLTLGALAEDYGVSSTPVRLALESLIDKRLVERQSNGRLRFKSPGPRSKKRVQRPSKPVDWESVLANEILILSLQGTADFLREEAMAEKHGIGRTLLRRVFNRLAGGGLIEHIPRRGWKVREFREPDMDAFIDIRETMELKALDLARPFLQREQLQAMLNANSGDQSNRPRIDNDLHRYFIDCSGNRYIKSFFDSHGGYYTALFDYATLGLSVVSEMAHQHCQILDHALHRRWAQSRSALANHISAQRPLMKRMIEQVRAFEFDERSARDLTARLIRPIDSPD